MKLEFLAQVLADAGHGTIGGTNGTIYVHYMPADVKTGILLRNPLDGTKVDPNLPDYYRSKLQAIVRSTTHAEGETLAKAVAKTMKMFNRRFLNDDGSLAMKINHIYPAQMPIVYPYSPANAIEWSLNFVTSYVQPE